MNYKLFFLKQIFFLLPLLAVSLAITLLYPEGSYVNAFAVLNKENTTVTYAMELLSNFGNKIALFVYFLIFVYAIKYKNEKMKWFVIYYCVVNFLVVLASLYVIKVGVGRPRPFTGETEFNHFTTDRNYHSFASGHVSKIAGMLGLFAQQSKYLLIAFAWGIIPALMGFARIFLVQHYVTDVIGGAIVGSVAVFFVVFLLNRKFAKEKVSSDVLSRL